MTYGLTAAFLGGLYLLFKNSSWLGNQQIYTLFELSSTLLAFCIGSIALIRYYTKKDASILFLAVGFLGVGLLEGYDAIVTSGLFSSFFPSQVDTVLSWSWFSSRIFLSLLLCLSILTARKRVDESYIYLGVSCLTLLVFLFFTLVELPPAYSSFSWAGRPAEFIPAILFLLAFIGLIEKGSWKEEHFEYLLSLFLVVSMVIQFFVAPFSHRIFDLAFHFSQIAKLSSYLLVLLGLLINMYFLFKEAEENRAKLSSQNKQLTQAQHQSQLAQKKLEKALLEAKEQEKTLRQMNKVMVGRELRMIELKNEVQNLKDSK